MQNMHTIIIHCTVLVSLSGARQSDVTNVHHKKSKALLDGVTISFTKNMINNNFELDASLCIYFVYNQNKDFSVQTYVS